MGLRVVAGRGARSRRQICALLALVGSACAGGSGEDAEFPSPLDDVHAQLLGEWKLVEFQIDGGGNDVIAGLLGSELRLHFGEDLVTVTGVGKDSSLPYSLSHPTLHGATLHLHTDGGVTYDVLGEFEENTVKFRSVTKPWRGKGSLVRP